MSAHLGIGAMPGTEAVAREKPLDLSRNGVNHPNDFGHRLCADVLDALFPAKYPQMTADFI